MPHVKYSGLRSPLPRPLGLVLAALFVAVLVAGVASLAACSNRVVAKPGIGVGVEQTPTGSNVGLNLGTYDVGGALAHPATGTAPTCSGPDCAVPGVPQTPPFRVQVNGLGDGGLPVGVWILLGVVALSLVGLVVLFWVNRPRAVVAGLQASPPGAAS